MMFDKRFPSVAVGLSLWLLLECSLACAETAPLPVNNNVTTPNSNGPVYPISEIRITYETQAPGQPDLADLLNVSITLTQTPTGFVAPRPGDTVQMRLGDFGTLGLTNYHGSALQAICAQLVEYVNSLGYVGVYIRPDYMEIDDTGRDLRVGSADQSLMLLIYTAVVAQQRTVAQGERIDPDDGINNPKHERILEKSPLQNGELVNKTELDRYTYWLNRHPGRRVDIALGPSSVPGGAVVDYIVSESKPWSLYFQIANNGTESTGEWRQRIGFVHNQFTSNDDIFRADFVTSELDQSNTVIGSYEAPIGDMQRWRWRVLGGWSQFDASTFGIEDAGSFEGEQWWFGNDVIVNVFQFGKTFIDVVAGARYQNVMVDNFAAPSPGETSFFLPHAGVNIQRATDLAVTALSADFQINLPDMGNTDEVELEELGRVDVEPKFMILTWSAYQSFFLEPLLWHAGWADPSTPGDSTLAHEIMLNFRGQHSFDERVAPQFEGVVGGMYTVRGYDESVAAGDTTLVFTAEYRLHVPRLFAIDSNPYDNMLFGKPFRWAPQEVYGQPDWDFLLRGFIDIGRTYIVDPLSIESDESLMGAGLGAELSIRRNLNIRADYGWALEQAGNVQSGDGRLHMSATLLY